MNEHLDMNGSVHDLPVLCHKCHRDIREEATYGSDAAPELDFCGLQCLSEWQDAELLRLGQYVESLQLKVASLIEVRDYLIETRTPNEDLPTTPPADGGHS